jgi:RNA polymerase sigma-70 factor (ECF subfamily)
MDLQDSLRRAQEQETAFKEIYDLTIDKVYGFALARLGSKELAKDLCQNVYLALWRALGRFKYISDAHFYAFLFKIVRRQLFRARNTKLVTIELDESWQVAAPAKPWEDYRQLMLVVQGLKPKEQTCIQLRYFQDWKFQDIALALNVTENNAKVIHHRALKKLQLALGENTYV